MVKLLVLPFKPRSADFMKAMILAAGFGTRLFPLTIDRTKPAIPFLGKPLVGYVAEYIAKFGFNDVVVNLHHQPQSVMNALGDGSDFGVKIEYSLEKPEILGTAGALDNARELLENDTFLIINGKIITDINIAEVIETHKFRRACHDGFDGKPAPRKFSEVFVEKIKLRDSAISPLNQSKIRNRKPEIR